MSVEVQRMRSSVPRPRRSSKPAEAQKPQEPPTPPSIVEVLKIVRNAQVYTAPTQEEITAAAQRHERGGRLLAAAAIQRMRAAQSPPRDEVHTYNLQAYLAVHGRGEVLPAHERAVFERKLREQGNDPHTRAALGFAALLAIVNVFANAFEAEYVPEGKADRAALGRLYDATDSEPPHPALAGLPAPSSYGEHDPRRNTVIHADRLLRFILLEAAPAEQQADTGV